MDAETTTTSALLLMNSSLANSTAPSNATDIRDESLARIEIATLAIIFALIIFGNVSVLIALVAGRMKMRRMYYFLLHLSIADLITGFFTVLPQLAWDITYRFYGGNFMCKFIKFGQLLGPYLSSYVLVVTAIDRYQAICFPLANCTWTARRSKLMIAFAWLVSIMCCAPQLYIFSYQLVPDSDPKVYDCWGTFPQPWGERAYVTWYAVTIFFIPLVVLTFTYVCICREIWLNAKRNQKFNKSMTNGQSNYSLPESSDNNVNAHGVKARRNQRLIVEVGANYRFRNNKNVRCVVEEVSTTSSEETVSRHSVNSKFAVNVMPRTHCCPGKLSRAKIKTIKITVVVIACYVFCSLPFICVQLWAYWWPNAQETALWTGPFITIAMLLSSLNSCVNPWIYLFFNRNLFNTLQKICCHPFARFRPPTAKPNVHEYNSSMHSEAYTFNTNNTNNTGHHDSGRERLGTGSGLKAPGSNYQLSPSVCTQMQPCLPITSSVAIAKPAETTHDDENNTRQTRAQVNNEPEELVAIEVNETST